MSYDMGFDCGPLETAHDIKGGTFAFGGTTNPWINVTYNYAKHFYRLWPENGIRHLYGMKAKDIISEIDAVLPKLGDDEHPDYWEPTEGNAKLALKNLKALASIVPPESVLDGD